MGDERKEIDYSDEHMEEERQRRKEYEDGTRPKPREEPGASNAAQIGCAAWYLFMLVIIVLVAITQGWTGL